MSSRFARDWVAILISIDICTLVCHGIISALWEPRWKRKAREPSRMAKNCKQRTVKYSAPNVACLDAHWDDRLSDRQSTGRHVERIIWGAGRLGAATD
jgi:hypothetical protein